MTTESGWRETDLTFEGAVKGRFRLIADFSSDLRNATARGFACARSDESIYGLRQGGRGEGAIPGKYKELLALGVAFTTQCPYCIEIHSSNARRLGTSDQEIAEAVLIAAALRAGGAITHGTHALNGA